MGTQGEGWRACPVCMTETGDRYGTTDPHTSANSYRDPFRGCPKAPSNFTNNPRTAVLSARTLVLLAGLLVLAGHSAEAVTSDKPCSPGGLATHSSAIFRGLTPKENYRYWVRQCRDDKCRAAKDLACAFEALNGRDWPNSMGRGDPSSYNRDLKVYNKTISDLGRTHPDRRSAYCTLLSKIAAFDDDRLDYDIEVTRWTTELAARISRPNLDCIAKVMAALPRTEPMRAVVADARENCETQRYPLCNRIVLPSIDPPHSSP